MLLYLASSFSLFEKVDWIASLLTLHGHHVVVRWWERFYLKKRFATLCPEEYYKLEECKYAYETDIQGVRDSDALILIAEEKKIRDYGGASVELGIATEREIPCFLLGRSKNSALYYGLIRCSSEYELIELLKLIDK